MFSQEVHVILTRTPCAVALLDGGAEPPAWSLMDAAPGWRRFVPGEDVAALANGCPGWLRPVPGEEVSALADGGPDRPAGSPMNGAPG